MSKLEVDAIEPQSGTTLTIGASGDTITIASGATLTGDLNATNLTSGTVPSARISGAYTGITNLTMSGDLTVDTNTLFVDASENSVGIKNTAPKVTLDVRATSFTPDNTNTSLLVEAPAVFSQAQHFYINNAGAYNSSRPTGGIGAVNSSNVITLTAGSIVTDNPGADGFKAYSTDSSLYDIGNAEHTFSTKTGLTVGNQFTHTKRVKIFNNGVTAFNDGIALGVGINNTASNVLDDYEEGTWTPSLSISSSNASGYYTVVGNIVHAYFKITTTTTGNNITMNNFPFATKGSTPDVVGGARETQTTGRFYQIVASQSNTSAYIFRYDNTNTISSGMVFQGSLIYQKA
jgi:hypothetical protein